MRLISKPIKDTAHPSELIGVNDFSRRIRNNAIDFMFVKPIAQCPKVAEDIVNRLDIFVTHRDINRYRGERRRDFHISYRLSLSCDYIIY